MENIGDIIMSLDMKERMLNGKPCLSFDKVLEEEKQHQQRLQFKFNHLDLMILRVESHFLKKC